MQSQNKKTCWPLVTVIINCYIGERFLHAALESLLSQTYQNLEVIFFDNASNDKSLNIVNSYADKRIRIISNKKTVSLGKARLMALTHASGDWVAFLDVDDIWLPDKVETQIKFIKNSDKACILAVATRGLVKYEKNNSYRRTNKRIPNKNTLNKVISVLNILLFQSILFERKSLQNLTNFKYLKYCPDYAILLEYAKKNSLAMLPDETVIYRVHDNNLTKHLSIERGLEPLSALRSCYPDYASSHSIFIFAYLRAVYWSCLTRQWKTAFEIIRQINIFTLLVYGPGQLFYAMKYRL